MSRHTTDATDADFATSVIARSREVPVLVDFWGERCGPCHALGALLEKVAATYGERLAVVKVDRDRNPQLTTAYGITAIPAVKLFKDGAVIDEFVGALAERKVLAFLEPYLADDETRAARAVDAALLSGDVDGAARAVEELAARAPERPRTRLAQARVGLARGDLAGARAALDAIPSSAAELDAARALAMFFDHADAGRVEATAAEVAARPDDAEARYAHGCALAAAGRYRLALDELLASFERDRRWRDEAARTAVRAIFRVIGVRSPLSDEYRLKLAMLS